MGVWKTGTGVIKNKTGLQPVSRPVELVYYFEGYFFIF